MGCDHIHLGAGGPDAGTAGKGIDGLDKLIISVATTGSATMRSQTPHVPITEEEIAQQA